MFNLDFLQELAELHLNRTKKPVQGSEPLHIMENANKDTYTLGLDIGTATHALCVLKYTGEILEKTSAAYSK